MDQRARLIIYVETRDARRNPPPNARRLTPETKINRPANGPVTPAYPAIDHLQANRPPNLAIRRTEQPHVNRQTLTNHSSTATSLTKRLLRWSVRVGDHCIRHQVLLLDQELH